MVAYLTILLMKDDDAVHDYSLFPSDMLASVAIAQNSCSLYFLLLSCSLEVDDLEKRLAALRNS